MSYQIELTEQPVQRTVSIRTRAAVGNLPQVLGQSYGAIMQYLGEVGENPCGAPFVAYYNTDMQDLDLEIGFPVSKTLPGKNDIQPGAIPAGQQVSCIHQGPYAGVQPVYDALLQWVKENGYTPTGTAYEFYLNDPANTPEDQLLTRVVFPLK